MAPSQVPPLPRLRRVHVFGASGSGTTTLGRAVAGALGVPHLDTDDFYWVPTDPPYRRKRPVGARLAALGAALDAAGEGWVLSGSLCGWGDPLTARFQLAVYLSVAPDERLRRLAARERRRYGAARLSPGGDMAEAHAEFMAWAARYEDGGPDVRSRARHERWLATLPCPVLRLDGAAPVEALRDAVIAAAG